MLVLTPSRAAPRRALLCGAALASILASATASAQGSGGKVAAEALFEQARSLVAEGKVAEACPKFADSQRLDPSPGTLLNLASCYEKLGRTASAWATYREAASAANATGRTEYFATAQRHAEALATHLTRLTIAVPQTIEGLKVVRDGVEVGRAEWGVPIPVDSGSHSVEASAPGYKGWASSVTAPPDGGQISLTVPPLEAAPALAAPVTPAPAPVVAPGPAPATAPAPVSTEPEASSVGSTQRVLGAVAAGVGVVSLAASGIFAILAKSQYNTSLSSCQPSNPNVCSGTGVSQRNTALTDGNVATVTLVAGGAILVGGAIVWFTAPKARSASTTGWVTVSPTVGGALVEGAF